MKKIILVISIILITFAVYIYVIQFKDWSHGLRENSLNIIKNTEMYMAKVNLDKKYPKGSFLSIEEEMLLLKDSGCNNKKNEFKIKNYKYAAVIHNEIVGKCRDFVELEIESFDWFFHRNITLKKFNTTCEIKFSHGKITLDSMRNNVKVLCWNKPLLPHL